MSDTDRYLDFLSFYLTLSTTLCSVGVSIFTLTVAFIVSKKDSLKQLNSDMTKGGTSLSSAYRRQSLQKFIKKMRKITTSSMWLICFSIISIFIIWILKLCPPSNWLYIVLPFIIVALVFLFLSICRLCAWYIKY